MKNLFFITLLLFGTFNYLTAQELSKMNPAPLNPVNNTDWRVLLQVTGPSQWTGSVNAVKPVSEKWYVRVGVSPIISSSKNVQDNADDVRNIDEQISRRNAWGAELGIGPEYHFNTKGRLDPFIGFGANLGFSFGKSSREINTSYNNPQFNGLIKSYNFSENKSIPEIRVNPFGSFGVNYFISPRFAIGAEYGIGPNFQIANGKSLSKINNEYTFDDGTVITETEENESALSKNLEVNLRQRVGLHFIYVFDKKK